MMMKDDQGLTKCLTPRVLQLLPPLQKSRPEIKKHLKTWVEQWKRKYVIHINLQEFHKTAGINFEIITEIKRRLHLTRNLVT